MLTRTFISEQFFHRRGNEIWIVAQPLQLLRIPHQSEKAVTDQIGCCFLTADHRDDAIGDDLFVGQAISIDFRGQKGMNQSFARMFAGLAIAF